MNIIIGILIAANVAAIALAGGRANARRIAGNRYWAEHDERRGL
jgi:hypothetical protein